MPPITTTGTVPDIETDPRGVLRMARDPSSDGETLRVVASRALPTRAGVRVGEEHRAVLAAVAAHPNAPPDLLARVAYHAPAAFCRNPVAPLLPLEDPTWIATVGEPTLLRILRRADAPVGIVSQAAMGAAEGATATATVTEEARLHVASAGECPPAEWAREVREHWRAHAAESDADRREVYAEFALLGILPDWAAGEGADDRRRMTDARERLWRAADPQTPEPERKTLSLGDVFWTVRLAAILNPAAPPAERHRLQGSIGVWHRGFRDHIVLQDIRRRNLLTVGEVGAACREALLLAATIRDDCPARPLAAFAGARAMPQRIEDPTGEGDGYERWPRLLGYVLGISPRSDGRWGDKTGAALEALSEDGNRWVRAAARARLKDPSIIFPW